MDQNQNSNNNADLWECIKCGGFTKFNGVIREKDRSLAGIISVVKSNSLGNECYHGIRALSGEPDYNLESSLMSQVKGFDWDGAIKIGYIQALAQYLTIAITKQQMKRK